MSDADSSAQFELPPPGERLAAARESRGMTVAEIAQQLKLSPWQVEALEAGDHQRLPGSVFVRGFIRNYARLVKLDPAELLEHAHGLQATATIESSASAHPAEIPYPTPRRVHWHRYAIGLVILIIPLAIYEFYPDVVHDSPSPSGPVETPALKLIAEVPATAVPPATEASTAAPAVTETPASDATRTKSRSIPVVTSGIQTPGEQVVRLKFIRESWVEIRDRDGRRILSQLNPPGTEQVVTGMPPLSLVVGNANGVRLTHNEQPVDLVPYTNVDVARLTLE